MLQTVFGTDSDVFKVWRSLEVDIQIMYQNADEKMPFERYEILGKGIFPNNYSTKLKFITSLTTFIGVMPLIFEKSLQAKFLVPMAVSLGFGVLFSTFVTLLLVPSTYIAFEKIKEYLLKKNKNQVYINSSHE